MTKTTFTYSNAPKEPKWTDHGDALQVCFAWDMSGGHFMAIRDTKSGEILKEQFYTTKHGRRKSLARFKAKLEAA